MTKYRVVGVLTTLASIIMMFGLVMLFMAILIDWGAGCGESFPTANGGSVMGQCIFLMIKG